MSGDDQTRREDDLLARELGKLGAEGAKMGAKLAGDQNAAKRAEDGSAGARVAAQYLPTHRYHLEIRLPGEPKALLEKAHAFLTANGRVLDEAEGGTSPHPKVSGTVGAGVMNMNPAVVHVEIVAADEGGCTLHLTGAAKEGLIKQRTAEKAVNRLADALGHTGPRVPLQVGEAARRSGCLGLVALVAAASAALATLVAA